MGVLSLKYSGPMAYPGAVSLFHPSDASRFLLAGFVFAGIKLVAAGIQTVLFRGDYRKNPDSLRFRIIFAAGKVTPALAAACFCMFALCNRDKEHAWEYGIVAVLVALLAAYIVSLRKQGRFFGILDLLSRREER